MSAEENERTVREFYACFESRDYADRVKQFLSPSVVWHVAGNNPLAGDYAGPDAVTAQMQRYEQHSRGTLRLETSIAATDSHAIAIHSATAASAEFNYAAHEVDVFHVGNGTITEFWSFSEDQDATDRIWS